MNASWIIPFIILGGALQSCGAAMNGQLNKYIVNPWLASALSFALITFFFAGASLIMPHPLPTSKDLASLPWSGRHRRIGWRRTGIRGLISSRR
jgi:bacterial/archaeal transporter family-2 protein